MLPLQLRSWSLLRLDWGFMSMTFLLSVFMSNTATADLVLPVGIASATVLGGTYPVQAGFCIAVAASLSMALPIITPPDTLAYNGISAQKSCAASRRSVIGEAAL